MLRRALVVVPALSALAVLVVTVPVHYFLVYLDDSATVPMFVAAAAVSATATYLLAAGAEKAARIGWALLAAVAGAAWFGLLLLVLWLVAIWVFDPD